MALRLSAALAIHSIEREVGAPLGPMAAMTAKSAASEGSACDSWASQEIVGLSPGQDEPRVGSDWRCVSLEGSKV